MHKRASKDVNIIASDIVSETTGEPAIQPITKNQAAVILGRLGGKKGGAARAKALSATRRQEIARKAANQRWKKEK